MTTQKQVTSYLKSQLPKDIYKRLRPQIVSNTFNGKKSGCYVAINIPAWIGINVDEKFNIYFNGVTYRISNKKVSVAIWQDKEVPAHIVVY